MIGSIFSSYPVDELKQVYEKNLGYLNDFKNLAEICKKNSIISARFNIQKSKKIVSKTSLNGIINSYYQTDIEYIIIYQNKYKIISNKNKKTFEVQDISDSNNILDVNINFFKYLNKDEKKILVKACQFFSSNYKCNFEHSFDKQKVSENLFIENPELFYSFLLYFIEKYGYEKLEHPLTYNINILSQIKTLKFVSDNFLLKKYLSNDSDEKNALLSALHAYLNYDNMCEIENIKEYISTYNNFKNFVYEKKGSSRFFRNVSHILENTYFSLNSDLNILFCAVNIFFNDSYKYNKKIDQQGEDFKINLIKTMMKSKFVGNIGEKIHLENCTIFKVTNIKKEFGASVLIKSFDQNYNIISFFISLEKTKDLNIDIGKKISFSGYVKDHRTYDGKKETVVNRVKFI